MTAASSVISAGTEHAETNVSLGLDYNDVQTVANSLPFLETLDDVISVIGPHSGEGEAYQTLHRDAERLLNAKQNEIRKLCRPWGVTLTAKTLQGTYPRRLDAELKRDIEQKMIERARELQQRLGPASQSTATEHARADFSLKMLWRRCYIGSGPAAKVRRSWQELLIMLAIPRIALVIEWPPCAKKQTGGLARSCVTTSLLTLADTSLQTPSVTCVTQPWQNQMAGIA
jgi:hypothetical protein